MYAANERLSNFDLDRDGFPLHFTYDISALSFLLASIGHFSFALAFSRITPHYRFLYHR